ncbi:MAG: NfeD family protein [Defluviitaleaceae bacterium]|nr:NfeD family protein [Defluviitaleaceae bacterium]
MLYFILFGIGAGFILISLVVGELGELGGFDGGSSGFAFFKPKLIAVFLVASGAIGLILTPNLYFPGVGGIILFISVTGGLLTAGLFNRLVIIPLNRAQNTSAFNIQDTIGTTADVISPIPQGGYGKIRYNISGSVVTSPAKSEDGNQISAGTRVEIIYVEKNTYFVRREEI